MFITNLINKITNFRVKVGDKLNTLKNQIGQLNSLTTTNKTDLVSAVNEVNNKTNGYIPYIGANKSVNLNTQDLTIGGNFEKINTTFEKSYLSANTISSTHFTKLTDVASFSRGSDSTTKSDCIVITLPIKLSTRWVMEVDIFSTETGHIFEKPTKLIISSYSTNNIFRSVTAVSNADGVKSVSLCRNVDNNTVVIIRSSVGASVFNYGKVNISNFYHGVYHNSELAVKANYKVEAVLESSLTGLTINGTITNEQFTRDSYLWNKGNLNPSQYVLQTSLNTQLANYVPINGVTTINNAKTFTSSPVVPNATLNTHAVNLGQLNSLLPSVNNGELTLTTGIGLSGSANFTANQAGGSTFSVDVANTHKLPSTAEWDDTLKKDESNIVTENFEITNGSSVIKVVDTYAISGEVVGESQILLGSDDGFAVTYYMDNGRSFIAGVNGFQGSDWSLISKNDGESKMVMPITGSSERVLTTGAKIGTTTYYANTQGVIELPEYSTYSAGNGLTLSGTAFSLPVTTSGSGNVVSEVTQTTNGITVNKGITAMTTSHIVNEITSTNIANWNNASTNSHSHSNINYLNSINQNLGTGNNVQFGSMELSAPVPYIDFHFGNSTADYTSRIIEESLGSLNLISKDSLKYNVDGATTPFLEIDKRGAIIGSNSDLGFETVHLNTAFGSLVLDDEGLKYQPSSISNTFGIESNVNAYYDMSLAGKLNNLKIKGRGSLGSPTNLLTGNNLTTYLFADVSNKDGLATFRVDNNITNGGIPVFAQWGASILAQTSDTMFTLSANPNTPEIFVSAGTTTNNINWNKKLAFSVNEFPLYAQAFYENSLRELKENIKPFNKSGIELINSLDIVTFDRKDSEVKNKIGIIADDSIDEVLSTKKDAVDLYNTVFIQAKAIQELDSKNKTLEERISQLEEIIKNML